MQSASAGSAAEQIAAGRAADQALPELANVYWRPRASESSLRRAGRLWTLSTAAHTIPFIGTAVLLTALKPIVAPVALLALVQAWMIPELYAARGANVVRQPSADRGRGGRDAAADAPQREGPERVALGLLGDLLDHEPRQLLARTGLVAERGQLGVWLVGTCGALLVRPGGRRVHCYCVKASGQGLPQADRIAHLLLALRTDESGFATVANLAFSGACWRLRRRLPGPAAEALDAGARMAAPRRTSRGRRASSAAAHA